ncbi:unnamed protein product [Knipowitschia caucasica]|uniref:Chemokine interleukin-8-like domain-containing protein n=1 Tax=Knipowitschia caucasica TaxID=637954 RepID=A0AAV2LQ03_KNICA
MSDPVRKLAFLLFALAAVWVQLHQAQNIPIRCSCPGTVKFAPNITDFEVKERRSGCDKTELIVTIAVGNNSTIQRCLDPMGKLAKAYFRCWENKNKNESRKHECIERKKKTDQ